MERPSQINIIHQCNSLTSGFNFIVPTQWWNQLLEKNKNVSNFSMIQELDQHPLKFLYQIDLLEICFEKIEKQMQSLENELQSSIKTIDGQLKEIKRKQRSKLSFKRSHSEASWWKIRTQSNLGHKKTPIISPKIKYQELEQWFDNPDWRVISPTFYRNICHNKFVTSDKNEKGKLIGIPVFIQNIDGYYELSYNIKQRISSSLYFHNLQKKDYCFIGYIELNKPLTKIMDWIYLTFEQLSLQYQQTPTLNKRNKIYCLNQNFFYHFQDYQKINQELPWQHAELIEEHYLNDIVSLKMIEISTYSDEVVENVENPSKIVEEVESRGLVGSKKKKENEGFQYHESTEGETQQQRTQRSFKLQKIINREKNLLELQRIPYSLFKKDYNIPLLLKISKENIKKSIEIPFSAQNNRMNTPYSRNGKYIIDKSCNRLKLTQSNEYEQIFLHKKQDSSQQIDQKKVPKDMILWLQRMALTALRPQPYDLLQKIQKQELSDNIKQKLQFESQTQKMEQLQDEMSSSQL